MLSRSRQSLKAARALTASRAAVALPATGARSARIASTSTPAPAARLFSSSVIRRDQEESTRPEINTPPSLYTFTEDEEMLRESGELPIFLLGERTWAEKIPSFSAKVRSGSGWTPSICHGRGRGDGQGKRIASSFALVGLTIGCYVHRTLSKLSSTKVYVSIFSGAAPLLTASSTTAHGNRDRGRARRFGNELHGCYYCR